MQISLSVKGKKFTWLHLSSQIHIILHHPEVILQYHLTDESKFLIFVPMIDD